MPALTQSNPAFLSPARLAGFLYLVIILCGVWAEGFARGGLIQPDDPQATASTILANLGTFRASLIADATMGIADVALAILFFTLLRVHGSGLALAATAFRLVQASIIGASLVLLTAVPIAATRDPLLALTLFEMHGSGYDIGLIFFGINALIMSVLLTRAGVPRLIAIGIGAAGIVYLTGSATRLIAPESVALIEPAYLVPLLAESALCLWLLIRGRV